MDPSHSAPAAAPAAVPWPKPAKGLGATLQGMALYHGRPRRRIACLLSPMRSGSTLLKSLLGQAPDVSHFPEYPFYRLGSCNRYEAYRTVRALGPEPILLLKHPREPSRRRYPHLPKLPLKLILLARDAPAVVRSLTRLYASQRPDTGALLHYWLETWQKIFDAAAERPAADVRLVHYEQLVEQPVTVTAALFEFLGSARVQGLDSYAPAPGHDWRWGQDDASDKIRSRRVQPTRPAAPDAGLLEAMAAVPGLEDMRRRLGYANRAHPRAPE